MGKRKKYERRKRSSSDSDEIYKRHELEKDADISVSDTLSAANSVLFEDVLPTFKETTVTMATGGQSDDIATIQDTLKEVSSRITKIMNSQDGLRQMLDSKLDKLKHDLTASIDNKISALRDDLAMNISRESNKIDQVHTTIQSLQSRMDAMENLPVNGIDNEGVGGAGPNTDIAALRTRMFVSLLAALCTRTAKSSSQRRTTRLRLWVTTSIESELPMPLGRPPLVMISFRDVEEKVLVLRNKYVLKDTAPYKQVFIKSSKSHAERLIELNARTLLRQLPQGKNFRVAANGRIRTRENNGRQNQPQPQDQQ
ncbi:hypothetical protein MAR_032499 [Mya arenaria]|uniref:Uncharacterized protein n=1 Tax=Mya arenaria TaxID=6604 RepID=A0ABY7F7G7_MYAAR|nr:hypothetical protein MAR_032499 [Mya arenaria]